MSPSIRDMFAVGYDYESLGTRVQTTTMTRLVIFSAARIACRNIFDPELDKWD